MTSGAPQRVTTGGSPVTTTYDAANRPTSTGYSSDAEGRLTARPTAGGQSFVWDDLGRLTAVKNDAGTVTLATYTYDPLDRLRLVDRGSTEVVRFRYVGLTTTVAQVLDEDAGTVSRNVATSWTGTRLADWTGAGSDLRLYGTNAHHDVTFTTGTAGTVTATARYDPWGTLAASSGTLPDFGFQGSFTDATTQLLWVVTRWYAPAQGRFISEDSLLGEPARPASRHLYAYGEGEPVGRWDPDGRFWYRVREGQTFSSIALRYFGTTAQWARIWNANRNRARYPTSLTAGQCIWVPLNTEAPIGNQCVGVGRITGRLPNENTRVAARTVGVDWFNLTRSRLIALTQRETGRVREPNAIDLAVYRVRSAPFDVAGAIMVATGGGHRILRWAGMEIYVGNRLAPGTGKDAQVVGHYVFYNSASTRNAQSFVALMGHEYVHVLQQENGGFFNLAMYLLNGSTFALASYLGQHGPDAGGPANRSEAIGYLWEGFHLAYGEWEKPVWCTFKPLTGSTPLC